MAKDEKVFACTIIIPTRNRADRLAKTIQAYVRVKHIEQAELLVVDDGSVDDTIEKIQSLIPRVPFSLRLLVQPPLGPAAARNLAVGESRSPILIFTGDDIEPSEDWLHEHLHAHAQTSDDRTVILGKTIPPPEDWHGFMAYLTDSSEAQFGYTGLDRGETPDHRHFYTSNISIKKNFLVLEPGPFNESFPHAAWEDVELAFRLSKRGMNIAYRPQALATHRHSYTFDQFLTRQIRSGESAVRLVEMHPELKSMLMSPDASFLRRMARRSSRGVLLAGGFILRLSPPALRPFIYRSMLSAAFHAGFQRGRVGNAVEVARSRSGGAKRTAVVIVNWNGKHLLNRCLPSLIRSVRENWPVTVVDNGSDDGSAEFVRTHYPSVRLIALDRNLGFAAGNNLAIREFLSDASIDYICLLNNDAFPHPGWIDFLINALDTDARAGMASPKILSAANPAVIDSTGLEFGWGQMVDRGSGEFDREQYDSARIIDGVCAAACMYRTAMLRQIGLFDESFGSYYEDVDISWRALHSGWRAIFVPESRVYHLRGATTQRDPAVRRQLMSQALMNRAVAVGWHATGIQKILFLFRTAFGTVISGAHLAAWTTALVSFVSSPRSGRPPNSGPKRPKHICYVISKLGVGGAEKNLLLLTQHLPRDKFAPIVLSLNGEGEYADRLRQAGVPVHSLGFPSLSSIYKMLRFFSRCRFDLFHGFMFHGNLAARLFGSLLRRPSISAVRVAEGEKLWHLSLDRWTAGLADRFTVNSRALGEFVSARMNVPTGKISFIPNALAPADLEKISDRAASRKALGIPDDVLLIAMIGRLHIQKDPETFVRAAQRLATEDDRAQFLIAGIGPMKSRLENQIRDAKLAGRFHLPGLVPPRDVYAACDIFVLPSRWEGFPNAAIEAMAAGRPVVLSDFEGASEVVDYGVTGLIFPREDDKAMAEAMLLLTRDPERRKLMGESARRTVSDRYTVARLVSENVAIYERLTGSAATK